MQLAFGSGNLYVTQLNDASGNVISNPTPLPLMVLQEASIDLSSDLKELYGQSQLPVGIGRGKGKLQIKVKPARIFAGVWNALFFGQTLNPGIIGDFTDTTGFVVPPAAAGGVTALAVGAGGTGYAVGDTVTASTGASTVKAQGVVTAVSTGAVTAIQVINSGSYTVAPTAAGATTTSGAGTGLTVTATTTPSAVIVSPPYGASASYLSTYVVDLGVINANTGIPLTRVASGPATGQYAVNTTTGVYTFASADAGNTVLINYQYSNTSALAGKNMSVYNLPMGYAPTFKADFTVIYLGKLTKFSFKQCVATKMNMAFKNEDFMVPEFDISCFDPGTGLPYSISTVE